MPSDPGTWRAAPTSAPDTQSRSRVHARQPSRRASWPVASMMALGLRASDHHKHQQHFGGRLAQAGTEVHLIDYGAHLLAVREHGLRAEWTCRLRAAPVLRTSAATATPSQSWWAYQPLVQSRVARRRACGRRALRARARARRRRRRRPAAKWHGRPRAPRRRSRLPRDQQHHHHADDPVDDRHPAPRRRWRTRPPAPPAGRGW
jgi:hypothetical protein